MYLHCTSSVVALEVSFPTLFFATHRYSPLSVLLTFVIANCFLSTEKFILEELSLVSIGDPSLDHDIDGTGFPMASQVKVTLSPSVFVSFSGWAVISGLSVIKNWMIHLANNAIAMIWETKAAIKVSMDSQLVIIAECCYGISLQRTPNRNPEGVY